MEKFTILDAFVPHTGGCKHINLIVRDNESEAVEEVGLHFSQFEMEAVDEWESDLFKYVFDRCKTEGWATVEELVAGVKNLQKA